MAALRVLLLVCLFAAGASTAVLNARWLLSGLYATVAQDQWRWPDRRSAARQVAGLTSQLMPHDAQALKLEAMIDLFDNQPPHAIEEYQQALRLAPADAFLWRDYALALIYVHVFDNRLEHAVWQAQDLAPMSRPLHLSLAVAGLRVYPQSGQALQALWLNSIRVAWYDQPDGMLNAAYLAGQELLLCRELIEKKGYNPWCAQARWRHGVCSDRNADTAACARAPRHPVGPQ